MCANVAELPVLRSHRFPKRHFDALCSGLGGPEAVRELRRTEYSRRLLLLKLVFEALDASAATRGPLAPAHTAWETLSDAQAVAPAEVEDLLMHPQVGSWAAYAVRRARGKVSGDQPLWIDLGALHTLSLIAAARVGLHRRMRLPVWHGRIMFPTLGVAFISDFAEPGYTEAEAGDRRIRLPAADVEIFLPSSVAGSGHSTARPSAAAMSSGELLQADEGNWWALRKIRAGTEPRLVAWLDDLDPFRNFGTPVPPERLSAQEYAQWHDQADRAWELLCRDHPETATAMTAAVVSIAPLPAADGWLCRSGSSGEAFGGLLVSMPFDEVALASALVHEFQHIKLGALMHLVPLCQEGSTAWFYAPWRDDPRPLAGLLQGVYAYVGITAFWRERRRAVEGTTLAIADLEFAYARVQTGEALRILADATALTPWGDYLLARLSERLLPWLDEPVPAEAARLAALLATGHRAGWRIRHLRANPADVDALERAWREGRKARVPRAPDTAAPGPEGQWSMSFAMLIRKHVVRPAVPLSDSMRERGVTQADVDLVRGERARAKAEYLRRLSEDGDDLDAWLGLGLAEESCRALLDRPEHVLAGYRRLAADGGAPDPADFAAWASAAEDTSEF